jgi:hypothetical protein
VAEAWPEMPNGPFPNQLCRPGEVDGKSSSECKINGDGCDSKDVTFDALELDVLKWDKTTKNYTAAGKLEAHALAGTADDWQMYLHGPMIRPLREKADDEEVPPFYVQATWTNQVYRFDNVKKEAGRGKPYTAKQKVVAHAIAPSTAYPLEKDGELQGLLVAEGQPFLISPDNHGGGHYSQWTFGGVDYINDDPEDCHKVFPSETDKESHPLIGEVVNSVSCNEATGICFFSVWKFYDDQAPLWNVGKHLGNDCLHYCVMEAMDGSSTKCTKAGVVTYETGDPICSKPGVGAVHGMVVDNQKRYEDPNQFDIFLVMTGGATFDKGESSLRKVKCEKTPDGDLLVTRSELFGRDLYEASVGRDSPFGMAEHDAGGDHAWPDESGKYLWVSTFRTGNAGVHMLDYETGELIYSVHGMDRWYEHKTGKKNYAYSAGIHGIGQLGTPGSTLVVGTSACTNTDTCAPIPYWKIVPEKLKAVGVMFSIDLSEILDPLTKDSFVV